MTKKLSTDATFTTADGQILSIREIIDTVKTSIDIYGKNQGRMLSAEDLEDLFQDAICKSLVYSGYFDASKSKVKTYFGRIAESCKVEAFQHFQSRPKAFVNFVALDGDGEECASTDIDGYRSNEFKPDRDMETEEFGEKMQRAIGSLPASYQLVLQLQVTGMKPRMMAEAIGCNAETASLLLHRARKALKKKLGARFLSEYGIAA